MKDARGAKMDSSPSALALVLLDVRFVPPGEAPRSITLSIVDRWAACSTSRGGRTHTYYIHVDRSGHTFMLAATRWESERACSYILGPSIKLRTTMGHHTRIASQVNTERASEWTDERASERVDRRARSGGGRWLRMLRWLEVEVVVVCR